MLEVFEDMIESRLVDSKTAGYIVWICATVFGKVNYDLEEVNVCLLIHFSLEFTRVEYSDYMFGTHRLPFMLISYGFTLRVHPRTAPFCLDC